jgi:outer membrane protein
MSTIGRLARVALTACAFLLTALSIAATASAQSKIAVIDLRRAVADTEDGLRVQAELQQLFDSRQTEYESKEKAYGQAKEDFEKLSKNKKAPEDELRKKYAELEKMAFDLQSVQVNYRREMQQKENQLMYPIVKQMLALVRRLASQSGYDMVLNKEAVPYYRSDLDITDRIIQMYNSNLGDGEKAPKSGDKDAKPAKAASGAPPTK